MLNSGRVIPVDRESGDKQHRSNKAYEGSVWLLWEHFSRGGSPNALDTPQPPWLVEGTPNSDPFYPEHRIPAGEKEGKPGEIPQGDRS
jgi:hypothetical protein